MRVLIIACFLFASALAIEPQAQSTAVQPFNAKFIEADINDYIDSILPSIIYFMLENGLDPMELPDIIEGFSVKPIIITYHGQLELTNGIFKNLRSLRRSGDVKVAYMNKILKISANFALDHISFEYDYLAKIMGLGPTGGVIGSVRSASVFTEVLIDFHNAELHLQDFYLYDVGRLSLRFTGNVLIDWLANALVGVITTLFKSIILIFVERAMRSALQDFINSVNDGINSNKMMLEQLKLAVEARHTEEALPAELPKFFH